MNFDWRAAQKQKQFILLPSEAEITQDCQTGRLNTQSTCELLAAKRRSWGFPADSSLRSWWTAWALLRIKKCPFKWSGFWQQASARCQPVSRHDISWPLEVFSQIGLEIMIVLPQALATTSMSQSEVTLRATRNDPHLLACQPKNILNLPPSSRRLWCWWFPRPYPFSQPKVVPASRPPSLENKMWCLESHLPCSDTARSQAAVSGL